MESWLSTVVTILIAGMMMVLPLMAMSERNDDVSQLTVQTEVADFVNNARSTGKIDATDYDNLVNSLAATGNTYDIKMEIQVLDENPRKASQLGTSNTVVGQNIYYSVYTSQILDDLDEDGVVYMKEGDRLTVTASNTNNTVAQMLKNFFYSLSGNDVYSIVGSHTGQVTYTGRE